MRLTRLYCYVNQYPDSTTSSDNSSGAEYVEYADEDEPPPEADSVNPDGTTELARSGSATPKAPSSPVLPASPVSPRGSSSTLNDDAVGFADFYPHFTDICEYLLHDVFDLSEINKRIFGKGKMKESKYHHNIARAVTALGRLKRLMDSAETDRPRWLLSTGLANYRTGQQKIAKDILDPYRRDSALAISPTIRDPGKADTNRVKLWNRNDQEQADVQRAIEASLRDVEVDSLMTTSGTYAAKEIGTTEHEIDTAYPERRHTGERRSLSDEPDDDSSVRAEGGSSPPSPLTDVAQDLASLSFVFSRNGSKREEAERQRRDSLNGQWLESENAASSSLESLALSSRPKRKSVELGDTAVELSQLGYEYGENSPPSPKKSRRGSAAPETSPDISPTHQKSKFKEDFIMLEEPSSRAPSPPESDMEQHQLSRMKADNADSETEPRLWAMERSVDDVIICVYHLWKLYRDFAFTEASIAIGSFDLRQAKGILDMFVEPNDLWPLISLSKSRIGAAGMAAGMWPDVSRGVGKEQLLLDDLRDKISNLVHLWWDVDNSCCLLAEPSGHWTAQ